MNRYFWQVAAAIVAWLGSIFCASSSLAQEFYKGKTIRIVVATSPGGGFDTYSRAIARHIGKHIPGDPTIIVENMPGAGFLIGTNYVYNQAKPDGLRWGTGSGLWCCISSLAKKEWSSTRAGSNISALQSKIMIFA